MSTQSSDRRSAIRHNAILGFSQHVVSTFALVLYISLSTMVLMTQLCFLERLSVPLGKDS
jgi:hypothetical protein